MAGDVRYNVRVRVRIRVRIRVCSLYGGICLIVV